MTKKNEYEEFKENETYHELFEDACKNLFDKEIIGFKELGILTAFRVLFTKEEDLMLRNEDGSLANQKDLREFFKLPKSTFIPILKGLSKKGLLIEGENLERIGSNFYQLSPYMFTDTSEIKEYDHKKDSEKIKSDIYRRNSIIKFIDSNKTVTSNSFLYKDIMQYFMINEKPSKNELAFIGFFQSFLESPKNKVSINNENLDVADYAKLANMKISEIEKAIENLERKEAIKIKRNHQHLEIYFNPFLISSGKEIDRETYDMFIDSKYSEVFFIINEEEGRNTPEYREWREMVLKRDGRKCTICESRDNVVAHHLDGYHWCEERRTDIENGRTLCLSHHKDFHCEYGYGNNTKNQFEEYLLQINDN